MDFHQLEYVIAVAEEKSISKAAKKLYISQPSLSQYIIRLEKELGVKLFDRSASSVILTFAGEQYVKSARNILNINKQLKMELSDIAGSKKGHIIIGIPNQAGRYILPLILPEFHRQFPQIEISIKEDVTMELEQMLAEGKIDIAVLNLPIQNDKLLYEPISIERIFVAAPKNHYICSKEYIKNHNKIYLNCLQNENFIISKQGQRMRLIEDEIFHKVNFKPNVVLEIENLDTAHRIAANGMGFTFVPENVIWLLNTDEYNNYFLAGDMTFTFVIAYRSGEYLSKAAMEFINTAKKTLELNNEARAGNRIYNKIYI